MKTTLKKTLLAALPLAGLLFLNAPASAHDDWQHERFHDQLGNLHEQEHENDDRDGDDVRLEKRRRHLQPFDRAEH